MPKRIIIVRHGETEYNVERRLQGWLDVPLNNDGIIQARKVAERLMHEAVSAIYTSDQKRALVTAKHISQKHKLFPHRRKALREDRLGILEGWQWDKHPDAYKQAQWEQRILARQTGDLDWKVDGGESFGEHTIRVKKFLHRIEKLHPNDTIMIVSHGGTINRILEIYGLKKITEEYIGFKNTSVTILIKNANDYELELHNDISHL
ncbi:MAG: histidine phosphatase family protein [bacterium]